MLYDALSAKGLQGAWLCFRRAGRKQQRYAMLGKILNAPFETGRVLSITYWGRDTKSQAKPGQEGDVFDVKFAHREFTFYIDGANGKIRDWAFGTNPPSDVRQVRLSAV
jgi:hypothetical protein